MGKGSLVGRRAIGLAGAMGVVATGLAYSAQRPRIHGDESIPKFLVVQSNVPATKEGDPNVPMAIQMSKILDDSGQVSTVVWDMTDPTFRDAVATGKVRISPGMQVPDILAGARAMGINHVLVFSAYRSGKGVKSETKLYHLGRIEWRDKEELVVNMGTSLDQESSAQSIARTILVKMQQSVLTKYPVLPKARTPEPTPGPEPTIVAPSAPVALDDDALQATVQGMLKTNDVSGAIGALRDAVDAAPFDARRRTMLIEALQDHDPQHAAEEAHRAELVLPDHGEFRLIAARAWMQAGRPKEAQEELNDAISRAPDAPGTRLLLGEIALENLDPEHALPHIDAALKADPSAEGYFLRALCRALLGGVDGAKLDMDAMTKAQGTPVPSDVLRRHRLAVSLFDQAMAKDGIEIREMIQKVAIKPKDAQLHDELADAQRRLAARIGVMEMLATPPESQKAHDRWLLAEKLLAQSLVDVNTYIGGADDALTDARMNLGEGIKQAELARAGS